MKGFYKLILSIYVSMLATFAFGQGSISPFNGQVCVNSSIQITATGSSATTGYTWTVPSSATILSGQGTNIVNVKFTSAGNFSVSWVGNGLGSGGPVQVLNPPGNPGAISGPNVVCPGGSTTFSISQPIANAQTTSWVATGATIASQNATTLVVNFPANFTNGTIVVYGIAGACGAGNASTLPVTGTTTPPPAAAGPITGPATLTPGQTGVAYSIPSLATASRYQWSLPTGITYSSGVNPNLNSITVDVSSSFLQGTLSVFGVNGPNCGGASALLALTASSLPAAAGNINGSIPICLGATGTTGTYSVPTINNATGYVWTVTGGAIIAGQNTNSITVQFSPSTTSASVSVYGTNSVGSGATSTSNIPIYKPASAASPIVGTSSVCGGLTNVAYSISPIANVSNYVWVLPTGVTLKTGSNTNAITVDYASTFAGGTITAFGVGGFCGAAASSSVVVTSPPTPATAGAITGKNPVCAGERGVTYSIPSVANATDYFWTVPTGVTIVSGQGTKSIKVDFASSYTPGTITAKGINACNIGPPAILTVTKSANSVPVITSQPSPTMEWWDGMTNPITVAVTATGSGITYQWRKGGNNIAGATSSSYQISYPKYGEEGNYDVVISSGGCSVTSNASKLTVKSQIAKNYIITRTILKDNKLNEDDVRGLPVDDVNFSIAYLDGLGRADQTVTWQGSPLRQDIVQPFVYDAMDRENLKYLPYVASENSGFYKTVTFDVNNNYSSTNFYNNTSDNIADDTRPFTETIFEASPLNRPLQTFGAGQAWKDNNSATQNNYLVNVYGTAASQEKIIAWKTDATGVPVRNTAVTSGGNAGYYASGKLVITSTKDEQGNETREYKDLSGKVILKKSYFTGTITDFNTIGNWAETYYIYDDMGNLRCILQPELSKILAASTTLNPTSTQLSNLAFQYKYDYRRRMIEKTAPGADVVYMVYDNRDRLVLTQDGIQRRNSGKDWLFTKYDELDRPILTGVYTHSSVVPQAGMIGLVMGSIISETYNGSASGPTQGYTNNAFPTTNTTVLTVTYYDRYDFKNLTGSTPCNYLNTELTGQEDSENNRVVGQVTGTKTNVLGTNTYLWTVNYYDCKLRLIQTVATNHKGGTDRITNRYDFVKLLETKTSHVNGSNVHSTKKRFDYDHAGRVTNTWHRFDSEPEVLLSRKTYNEIGQLALKNLHSRSGGSPFAQATDYRYTIRGWLDKINDPGAPEVSDLFSIKLNYNNPTASGGTAQYNGNISEVLWLTTGSDNQSYGFKYDNLNRLTEAKYYNTVRPLQNGRYDEKIGDAATSRPGYDLNGNILNLLRKGKLSIVNGANTYGLADDLAYDYTGNKLNKVDDAVATGVAEEGFKESVENTTDYTYDQNGNLTTDLNKGVTSITYNYLNLPLKVSKSATDYVNYVYDASGRKLYQELYAAGTLTKTTDYLGEYVYENNALQFINHEEGRIVADNSAGAPRPWEYQYYLKDHLGNIRLTFSEKASATETKATLEDATQSVEQSTFKNYSRNGFALYNHTPGTGNTYSQLLNAGNGNQVGLAKSFSVNAGDVTDIEVFAKYEEPTSTNANVNTLLTALTTTFALGTGASGAIDGPQAQNAFNGLFTGGAPWITSDKWEDGSAPKAYLNYILFDENFTLLDFGFDQISVNAKQVGVTPVVPHDYLSLHVKATKKGFLYVYLSNEQPTQTNVYFDDLKITYHSNISQINDYYPFGLTFNTYARENSVKQNYLYNGKEQQDELALGWLDYGARMYSPEVGRWQILDPSPDKAGQESESPYGYVANNPVSRVDPDGKIWGQIIGALTGAAVEAVSQVAVSVAKGESFSNAVKNIDYADVGAAALEGAITSGGSVLRKVVATVVTEVVTNAIDYKKGKLDIVGTKGSEKTVGGVITDSAKGLAATVVGSGVTKGLSKHVNGDAAKALKKTDVELKNSKPGSKGQQVREAAKSQLKSDIKGNEKVSEAVGTVAEKAIDGKLKD